jgi:hypothetical protein
MFYKQLLISLPKKISKTSPPKSEGPSPLTSQSPKQSTLQVLGKEQGGKDLAPSNEEANPIYTLLT